MPRQVTFEGRSYSFPDDATDAEISEVLEQQQPQQTRTPTAPQSQQATPRAPAIWSNVSRDQAGPYVSRDQAQRGGEPQAQRDRYLGRNYTDFGGAVESVSQGATFGFGDEIAGGLNAFGAGVDEAFRGGPNRWDRIQGRGRRAYEDTVDTSRLFMDRNRQDHPVASTLNEIGGGVVTGGVGSGRAVLDHGARRGLPLFARQSARASATGAVAGATYGAGANEGGLEERLQAANDGGAMGAAIGAGTPAAINIARPILGAGARAFERIPVPEPNSVGAMGRPMRGSAPRAPRLPRAAAGTIDRLADRAGMSPQQVEAALAGARRNPNGQVLADIFDEPGRQTTRALAQWPGRTGQVARETARTRFAEAPGRILSALRRGLKVGETREQAMTRLAGEYQRASAETYQPLFAQPMSQGGRETLEAALEQLRTSPTMRRAARRADELFADERAAGLVRGNADDHYGRYAHYLRMALSDMLTKGRRDGSLVGASQRAAIELRNNLTNGLEEALPGYREARQRWSGLADAEDALDEGAKFINMLPNEVRARMQAMTEFERNHARIGLADGITQGMRGGRVVGQQNVSNALDYRDTQEIIAAAFDDPQQAADFLDTLNTSNQLMRNAQTWGGGSSTAANVAHGADEALSVGADMAGDVLSGRGASAIGRGVRGIINTGTLGAIERANNTRGEALLRRVDTPDAATFAKQVVAELRRRQAARLAASQASQASAAGGGIAQGRRD